jgi:hypothetical protein
MKNDFQIEVIFGSLIPINRNMVYSIIAEI